MGVSLCRASVSPRLHSARSVVTLLSSPTVPRLLAGSIRSLAIFLLEWPIWIGLRTCRSEEDTSELQSRQYLHSFPTRRSSDLDTTFLAHGSPSPRRFDS